MENIDFELLEQLFTSNDIETIKKVITRNNVNDTDGQFGSVVHYACKYGPDDPRALYYFASIGIRGDLMENANQSFWAPIHRAAMHGQFQLVKALVQLGVSVNLLDCGRTPLDSMMVMEKLHNADMKMCMYLLDIGATSSHPIDDCKLVVFVSNREATRNASIIVLGLHRCRCTKALKGNGKDVLLMIARCLWSIRGQLYEK